MSVRPARWGKKTAPHRHLSNSSCNFGVVRPGERLCYPYPFPCPILLGFLCRRPYRPTLRPSPQLRNLFCPRDRKRHGRSQRGEQVFVTQLLLASKRRVEGCLHSRFNLGSRKTLGCFCYPI